MTWVADHSSKILQRPASCGALSAISVSSVADVFGSLPQRSQRGTERLVLCLALAIVFVLGIPAAEAGPVQRHLEEVLPRAGQRGTTVDVTIRGVALEDVREAIFYRGEIEGVEFSAAKSIPTRGLMHGARMDQEVTCRFRIAADAPLGVHPFRLRTARELTTVSTFAVTPFPIVKETEEGRGKNDTADRAEAVPAGNVTVAAELHGDIDTYRVSRKAGERISVEIDSVWLADVAYADSEYDLTLQIVDEQGTVLGRNDDSALHVQDPILSVLAPRDGDYFVVVKQSVYRDSRVPYLAHIGTFVRPLVAFPPGGPMSGPLTVQLLGDPAGPREATIAWALSESGDYALFPNDPAGSPPSPVLLRTSPLTNVLEHPTGPTSATLPAALNGIIAERFQEDQYRFSARKGERYRVQVFARGVGSPLDPRVWIQNAKTSHTIAEGDDTSIGDSRFYSASGSIQRKELLDSTFIWEVGEDGDYLLGISDMRGLGDPLSVYRIEIEPAVDGISTSLFARVIDSMQCPRLTATAVPVGNRWTVTMNLKEQLGNRYKGPLELVARGLPEGVTMVVPPIAAGQSSVPVQFIAAADAKPQSALIEVLARPAEEKADKDRTPFVSRSQESFPFVSHSGGRAWHPVTVDRYTLAVTETSPFTIEVVPPKIPLIRSGSLDLDIQVRRNPGFTGPIDVQVEWLPPGVAGGAAITIQPDKSSTVYNITASGGAPIGTSQMALVATTTGGVDSGYYTGTSRMRVSTPFFPVEVADPHIDVKAPPTAIRRGQKGRFVWTVEHRRPFEGEATATLLGLPTGTRAVGDPPRLKAGQKELAFEVEIAPETLLGSYRELACEVTLVEKGEEIKERLGRGTLRVDP